MARPKKEGLSYFPTDTNIYNNQKLVNLSTRFGSFGSDIYCRLLAAAYQKYGYFLEFDLNYFDFFIGQTKCPEDTFFEILNFMNSRDYIKAVSINGVYDDDNKLCVESLPLLITGESIQEQFRETIKNMKRKPSIYLNLWLLEIEDSDLCFDFKDKCDLLDGVLPDSSLYRKNIEFLQSSGNFEFLPNKPEETGKKLEETGKKPEETQNDSEFLPVSFIYKKEREREKEREKEKEREREKKKETVKKSVSSETPTGTVDKDKKEPEGKSKPVGAERKIKTKSKSKKSRFTKKDYPENNNGEPVSKLEDKKVYGEFENVWLTDRELELLGNKCPGYGDDVIKRLGSYKAQKGKGYQSDYAAMTHWVIDAVNEDRSRKPKGKRRSDSSSLTPDREAAIARYEESIMSNFKANSEANSDILQDFGNKLGKAGAAP